MTFMKQNVSSMTPRTSTAVASLSLAVWAVIGVAAWAAPAIEEQAESNAPASERAFRSLRDAIEDITHTFGGRYARGKQYLDNLDSLRRAAEAGESGVTSRFAELKRRALLDNPLLDFESLAFVRRRCDRPVDAGMPTNHECNSSLGRSGWNNEIALLAPRRPDGPVRTLYRPPDGGYVGELDLHWDGRRLLFTQSDAENWELWEIGTDGAGLRQVSHMPDDVDTFDGCYLPDGRIVFGSTASFQSVPCWHGQRRVSNLFLMNADGGGVRQLCFDQDHDLHPSVLPSGQVLYHRWEYAGINHIFLRELMVMNPDGTGQRSIYGSNSWYPNALYFPRAIAGDAGKIVCILSGYHGVNRAGQLVVLDTSRGWHEASGMVRRISGCGAPIDPKVKDRLVDDDWPRFLHPYPLSDKCFLVACLPGPRASWGIYLADVFDNLVLLREERGFALLEPIPLKPQPRPPVIHDRVEPGRTDAVVSLQDVYAGPGLDRVPRGTVKRLRVVAYDFGYPGLAGPDVIGYGGPWEALRILGTVPIEQDGSAVFRVPANTPLTLQPLDADGKAVQLMRSWFTAMPGERVWCVGCHESSRVTPLPRPALAARDDPREIEPWRGPPRGFDFAREVQPVLDRFCVGCHRGAGSAAPDLRPVSQRPDYAGRRISDLGVQRMHPQVYEATRGVLRYTPAYEALLPYIRRVGIEDDVSLLVPGEFHADTSELSQTLLKGHHGVQLDAEAWDRLVTWIDLNAPCHGSWSRVQAVPDGLDERRLEMRRRFGGPQGDPEFVPESATGPIVPVVPSRPAKFEKPPLAGWPMGAAEARRRQTAAAGGWERTVNLGNGVSMNLVLIPAGKFVMGSVDGPMDEHPPTVVEIREPFWMGACEVTNEQFRRFDSEHNCGYYAKRHARQDDQGLPLNGPKQPTVRVSWDQAADFCRWLSEKTGMEFSLATEAEWEYACRAGTETPLWFGAADADVSRAANLAGQEFSVGLLPGGKQITGGLEHLVLEGADLADRRFSDEAVVTVPVGTFEPNAWGLFDMHGNAAEWTLSDYRPYPYRHDDGRNARQLGDRKVVRGGSFFDRPARSRSAFRLSYSTWQRVFNVGFRVVARHDAR